MKKFENIIIGFGKGGKTLAASLAKAGQLAGSTEHPQQALGIQGLLHCILLVVRNIIEQRHRYRSFQK